MSIDPVIRDLGNALRDSQIASNPGIAAILCRALARSANLLVVANNDTPSFFRQLGKEIIRLRGTAHAEARLECLYRACEFLSLYGASRDAVAYGHHAIHLAKATNRAKDLRRFYAVNGILWAELGDRGLALQSYVSSLELAVQLDDGLGAFAAWNNLSALFVDSGLYEEAITCGAQAIRVADRNQLSDADVVGKAQNNIALARYRLGDFRGALESARRSLSKLGEPTTYTQAAGRIVREEHLILALIAMGSFREARSHVGYIKKLVSRFPSPRQLLVTATVEGLYEVLAGNVEAGIRTLEDAVSIAETRRTPAFSDAVSALALAYDATGDCERALETTRRLVRFLENIHLDTSIANLAAIADSKGITSLGRVINRAELRRREAELESKVLQRELARSRQEMLERMAVAADVREDISGEHGYRVGRLAALLAKEVGWDRDAFNALDIAARLHDIGKIGIPEKILLDAKTLKEAEKHFIASHTLVGAEILSKSDIPQVRIAEEIARCHHEWWDGTGYPKGLKGMAIPKSARIVALADAFDAMTHGRPYAQAMPIMAALDQIATLRGRQFDPELTDHFLALVRRLAASTEDLDAYLGKAARNSPFLKARARIKEMLAQGRDSTTLSPTPLPLGTQLN